MFDVMSFIAELEKECSDFKRNLSQLEAEEQMEIIKLACSHVYPEESIVERLPQAKQNKKPLTVKFGIDPMKTNVMMDRMPPIVLLSKLQRMGYKVVFLIGDFTALIGDPSDITINQKKLNRKKIEANVKTLKKDLSQFIELGKTDTIFNSAWLNELKLPDLVEIAKEIDIAHTLNREDFKNKLDKKESISYAELMYPLIMGIDSLQMGPDMELGREDQLDNLYMCRRMMEAKGMESEAFMTTYALPQGDIFSISQDPLIIYEKIAKLEEQHVLMWYKLLTEITPSTASTLEKGIKDGLVNIQTAKEVLAKIIVSKLHGKEKSELAYIEYIKNFVKTAPTKEIRMISGSIMSIGEFIAASTEFTLTEAESIIMSGGARALSCDGGCLTYILDSNADISTIYFDKFYIIMGDKLVLRIKK